MRYSIPFWLLYAVWFIVVRRRISIIWKKGIFSSLRNSVYDFEVEKGYRGRVKSKSARRNFQEFVAVVQILDVHMRHLKTFSSSWNEVFVLKFLMNA